MVARFCLPSDGETETEWDVRQNNTIETESREQAEKLHIKG